MDRLKNYNKLHLLLMFYSLSAVMSFFLSLGIYLQYKKAHPFIPLVTSSIALAATIAGKRTSIKADDLKNLIDIEKHQQRERNEKNVVLDYNPELVPFTVRTGIAGKVQSALMRYNIEVDVPFVVDGLWCNRVGINLREGYTIEDIESHAKNLQATLGTKQTPIITTGKECNVYLDIERADRRYVDLNKYLRPSGFYSEFDPVTLILGEDILGKPRMVEMLDSNYAHPATCGGTGSGKSENLLAWLRWLTQWEPSVIQIVPVDLKLATFNKQDDSVNRIRAIMQTTNLSREDAEALFPDQASADKMVEKFSPWLPFGIIQDAQTAIKVYKFLVNLMMARFQEFREYGAKDIVEYNHIIREINKKTGQDIPRMPVFFNPTDEYYMLVSKPSDKEQVEESKAKLGAMARAAGVIFNINTQRISYDVLPDLIRANCMLRGVFRVKSGLNSQIGLGMMDDESGTIGAELFGKGHVVYDIDNELVQYQACKWDGLSVPDAPNSLCIEARELKRMQSSN